MTSSSVYQQLGAQCQDELTDCQLQSNSDSDYSETETQNADREK